MPILLRQKPCRDWEPKMQRPCQKPPPRIGSCMEERSSPSWGSGIESIWPGLRTCTYEGWRRPRPQQGAAGLSLQDDYLVRKVNYSPMNWRACVSPALEVCSSAKSRATMGILTDTRAAMFVAAIASAGPEKPQQTQLK